MCECISSGPHPISWHSSYPPGFREVTQKCQFLNLNSTDMDSTLQFRETYSVPRFKQVKGISSLNIIKNPHTDKMFFTCPDDSTVSGKVSTKDNWQDNPAISLCVDTSTGEQFYLLHKQGSQNNNVVATL